MARSSTVTVSGAEATNSMEPVSGTVAMSRSHETVLGVARGNLLKTNIKKEQWEDPILSPIIMYLKSGALPEDKVEAWKVVLESGHME